MRVLHSSTENIEASIIVSVKVMKAESQLRDAGLLGDLNYKPDIFTHLGIYRNNIWGFRPSIYTSKKARHEKKSKITVTGTGKD